MAECSGLLNRRSKDPQVRILYLPPVPDRLTVGHHPLEVIILVRIQVWKQSPSNPVVEIVDLKSIQRWFESNLGHETTDGTPWDVIVTYDVHPM